MGLFDKVKDFLDDGKINGSVNKTETDNKPQAEVKADAAAVKNVKPKSFKLDITKPYDDPVSGKTVTVAVRGTVTYKLLENNTEDNARQLVSQTLDILLKDRAKAGCAAGELSAQKEEFSMAIRGRVQTDLNNGYIGVSFSNITAE